MAKKAQHKFGPNYLWDLISHQSALKMHPPCHADPLFLTHNVHTPVSGICTCYSLYLKCPFCKSLSGLAPSLHSELYSNFNSSVKPFLIITNNIAPFSLSVTAFLLHSTQHYQPHIFVIVSAPLLKCKLPEARDYVYFFCPFPCPWIYPQCPEQCLAHIRH